MAGLGDRRALVIGAGGLGGPAAIGLAAAGVGTITLLDTDTIDPTNLGRQVLFGDADVGRAKVEVIAEALRARFAVDVVSVVGRFERDDVTRALVTTHDVVLDGTDNFPTRFAANDLCVAAGRMLVHGAALQWLGQAMAIVPGVTPCLRCAFEGEPPGRGPTCAEAGVVTPLVGRVGARMAAMAIELLSGRIPEGFWTLDAWRNRERIVTIGRDPSCEACSLRRSAG